jgi:hypothetical protein
MLRKKKVTVKQFGSQIADINLTKASPLWFIYTDCKF